jgi:hypothetical protein
MKKVVRLTENDLMRIVERVISEQVTKYNENEIKSMNKFLTSINAKGRDYYWKQESIPSSIVVKLPSNARITELGNFDINKQLNWFMYDKNNKKIDNTRFQIYKSQGELFFSYRYNAANDNKKLIGNEREAINVFNGLVYGNLNN